MRRLYEGDIKKNFFLFSLPLVLTIVLSQAYNIINTIMSGYLIGDEAISAIGSTAPLISFISSICWGYGTGFSVYVAMLFGSGQYKKMANVIKVNMLLSSAFVVLLSVACILFHNQIFSFLNIEEAIYDQAYLYFAIYIGGLVFFNVNWCGVYISNAMGLTKLPLIASVMTNVLNIFMNYVLIKWCGFGVEGTAIATVFSAFCVAAFYYFMMANTFRKLNVKMGGVYFLREEWKDSLVFAFPSMLQQSIMYLCTALVSPLTNLCGANAIAGYTVGMRIYDLNAGVYQNSNKTVSTYIAQCVGAKKYSILKTGIKIGLTQTTIICLVFLVPSILGAGWIAKLFLDAPQAIHYATVFLRFCMPFILFNVINNLMHAVFRSSGAGKYLVASTVIYALARFGFSYLLYGRFEMYGIYMAIALSWITEAIFGLIIYFSGMWKNEAFKKEEAKE